MQNTVKSTNSIGIKCFEFQFSSPNMHIFLHVELRMFISKKKSPQFKIHC